MAWIIGYRVGLDTSVQMWPSNAKERQQALTSLYKHNPKASAIYLRRVTLKQAKKAARISKLDKLPEFRWVKFRPSDPELYSYVNQD